MRLDKFLKVSRIIKRRPIAKLVVDGGKVKLDGKVVKAAAEVKVGQTLEIEYYNKYFKFEILQVPLGNVSKDKTSDLVKLLDTKGLDIEINLDKDEDFLNKYKIYPNAKINIGLNVYQKAGDGYHEIDSVMSPIDLSDEMDITFYSEIGDLKISCSDKNIPTDERNILYKAYEIFFENSKKHKEKIEISLTKNIPSEAGLGGGSSDAGFFLKLLNEHYGNVYNEKELEELAMKVGSDVPFFIKNKTARVGGKGNKIELVENNLKDSLILVKPLGFGVSTKDAYNSFDELDEVRYSNFEKIVECLRNDNRKDLEKYIENGLEQGISERNADIKMFKAILNSVVPGKKFFMSGSGSTYYTFVTEIERSQIETRLRTFVDNVKIIISKTIN